VKHDDEGEVLDELEVDEHNDVDNNKGDDGESEARRCIERVKWEESSQEDMHP
jgi:hypothetical protein